MISEKVEKIHDLRFKKSSFTSSISVFLPDNVLSGLLLAISFLSLFWGIRIGLSIYDEGVTVYGATRVLGGQIPYRDFWTIYSPGIFYMLAAVFKLFGASILIERIFSTLIRCLIAILTYFVAARIFNPRLARLSLFLATLWLLGLGFSLSGPALPAIAFSLLSCFFLIGYFTRNNRISLFTAGICAGLAGLVRQDFGLYIFFAATLVIFAFVVHKSLLEGLRKREPAYNGVRAWALFLFGVTAVVLPAVVFFVTKVPVHELLDDLVRTPLTIMPKFRDLPYPSLFPDPAEIIAGQHFSISFIKSVLSGLPFYFPFVIGGIAVMYILSVAPKRFHLKEKHFGILLILLLGFGFFNQARVRSDHVHLIPVAIPAVILFPLMLSREHMGGRRSMRIFGWILFFLLTLSRSYLFLQSLPPQSLKLTSLNIPRGKGILIREEDARNLEQTVQYIQAKVPRNDDIFVGNLMHDRIFENNIMFYFLCERHSATKYYELHPGVGTTLSVQNHIVDALVNQKVNYVVLCNVKKVIEPNESKNSSGIHVLDNFLRRNYEYIRNFGGYLILKRKEE
jgi:uncharacterized membrane protein SirB2/uncharacterized membrane protein (UPF0136 family)